MPKALNMERGMSLIEIVIALAIVTILTAISVPLIFNHSKAYKSEDQAIKVIDLMRESAQLALTRRRTMRFEIAWSDTPVARIIDENGAAADITLKTIPLEPVNLVRMDVPPDGVNVPPPNYPAVSIAGVTSARFRSDGSVVNAADLPISGTLFSWPPKDKPYDVGDLEPRRIEEVRAITLDGASGAIRLWRYDGANFVSGQ
ncbi:MAG: type II secretion system protein [Pyrinomonadaceae bacterium]